jgi:uncharacterized protein YdeI (YjbR/CyaY-like superfamily)
MQLSKTFHAPDRETWRHWLEQHHADETEVWLVYYKKNTGQPCVPYDDSVEEALCFGWVDSLIQKIDDERYARKFTPRRIGSAWSDTNKRRVAKVIAEGRMTTAGLAKIDYPLGAPPSPPVKMELIIPDWLKTGLQSSPLAWENFSKMPSSHQKRYVMWLSDAKKEETRQKRIREAIALLEHKKRLGIGSDEVSK